MRNAGLKRAGGGFVDEERVNAFRLLWINVPRSVQTSLFIGSGVQPELHFVGGSLGNKADLENVSWKRRKLDSLISAKPQVTIGLLHELRKLRVVFRPPVRSVPE